VGETGNAITVGCHLHFEVHAQGVPIDPAPLPRHWDALPDMTETAQDCGKPRFEKPRDIWYDLGSVRVILRTSAPNAGEKSVRLVVPHNSGSCSWGVKRPQPAPQGRAPALLPWAGSRLGPGWPPKTSPPTS
jgi:hypothetical protein